MDKYYPNGELKAKFMGYLKAGECPCKWEKEPNHFTDGTKKYLKIV